VSIAGHQYISSIRIEPVPLVPSLAKHRPYSRNRWKESAAMRYAD
jgi:hypothetical protein